MKKYVYGFLATTMILTGTIGMSSASAAQGTTTFKLSNGREVTVRDGSNAYNTYMDKGLTQVGTGVSNNLHLQTPSSSASSVVPESSTGNTYNNTPYSPGSSADNQASFNGSNWSAPSGVYTGNDQNGYTELTHKEATVANPLHPVNGNRQSLIKEAVQSGDWTDYKNFEAKQNPAHYTQQADGNYTYNKEYWKVLIVSSLSAQKEAETKGDTVVAESWARNVRENIEKMKESPGVTPYMVGINSHPDYSKEYGVEAATDEWINGPYNSAAYLRGMASGNGVFVTDDTQLHWSNNAVFQENPNLLADVLTHSSTSGTAEEQAVRNEVNQPAYETLQQQPIQQQPVQKQEATTNSSSTSSTQGTVNQQVTELNALTKELESMSTKLAKGDTSKISTMEEELKALLAKQQAGSVDNSAVQAKINELEKQLEALKQQTKDNAKDIEQHGKEIKENRSMIEKLADAVNDLIQTLGTFISVLKGVLGL